MDMTTLERRLTGRCQHRRKMANNTWAIRDGDDIVIRLHQTDIVRYKPNGDIVLDSGGWRTMTTKDRIGQFAPVRVYQSDGEWWLTYHAGSLYAYADGMILHPDGTVTGALGPDDMQNIRARNRAARRKIDGFVKSITPERIVTAWENTLGDCLLCRVALAADQPTRTFFGFQVNVNAPTSGDDCVHSHVDEGYFHASLAYRAVRAAGYGNPDYVMSLIYHLAQRGEVDDMLTRPLRKFLRAHLLEGVATR